MPTDHDDDDDDGPVLAPGKQLLFEFDCPDCNANNPWPDGFKDREELTCHYCGASWEARLSDEGRLKLKSL